MRLDLSSLEAKARDRLDPLAYHYYRVGAGDELTLAANVVAWSSLALRPRVLCDVGAVRTETTVLGTPVAAPVLVAPTAVQRLLHPEGEAATRRGTAVAGSLMVVSTRTSTPVPDVAAAAEGPWWFQVYVLKDRGLTEELVRRAADAGAGALVLTGDTPLLGWKREPDPGKFTIPDDWFMPGLALPDGGTVVDYSGAEQDPCVAFADLEWLAGLAGLPLVVKGVLRADDAELCVDAGAAGVIVSNHGGRQLDGAIASAAALPEVAQAVGDRAEVYVDGGIRRGTDVLRALALGARAVLVGRPVAWGLAVDGEAGVRDVLETLQAELAEALALCGVADPGRVAPDLVVRG